MDRSLTAHLVTGGRVALGAVSVQAALDGWLTGAAAGITMSAVLDGIDGALARRLNAVTPFGALFDYFCDYLCFIVAPWALAGAIAGRPFGLVSDVLLALPLLTGAIRYARNGVLVMARRDEVTDLPGLGTVFFAFVAVVAVFMDAAGWLGPSPTSLAVIALTVLFSVLMVIPVRYPKLSEFPGARPAVLVLLTLMPVVGTQIIAAAALVIGLVYVGAAPLVYSRRARPAADMSDAHRDGLRG